jgi:DNA-binding HxlR family transcriptional regulator
MRSYGHYCSIARALDVVGDRWALLIVRELLLQGSCRFTDLKHGLPGVAPSLLSARLKELEEAGLIAREDAPPPIATTLYALTPSGRALEPVLRSIGAWGRHLMVADRGEDAFQSQWLAYSVEWFTTDADPEAPQVVIQLIADDTAAVVEVADGSVKARPGRAPTADLTIEGPPRSVLGLVMGVFGTKDAGPMGLTLTGRRAVLARLRPLRDAVERAHHADP